jgi:heptosyltransferase-1
MRVLIVKTSSMGDVIHSLPALSDATARFDNIQFDWLVEEAFAEIPQWHGAVNRVIPIALRRWRKSIFNQQHWRELHDVVASIRAQHYDIIIDAQGLIKSAILSRLAQGERSGLNFRSCREPLAAFAYQHKYPVNTDIHAIERIRQLFALSLAYSTPTEVLDYGLQRLQWGGGNNADRYLVFVHSASRADKLWPTQCWIDLAVKASHAGYRVVLLWGNDEERQRAQWIASHMERCQVMPLMSLTAIAQLFQQAQSVIGVDTGLSHLAAAIGVPAVSLYFQTSTQLVGTRGKHQHCLTAIPNISPTTHNHSAKSIISVDRVWNQTISAIAQSDIIK